ncbi:unnamed protein product [Linum trigynum]|uniref:Uncharacterized protein n=1 Tax=Linum trigynum TaxID=586398 RepID=A0AAV2FQ15_9ROSI
MAGATLVIKITYQRQEEIALLSIPPPATDSLSSGRRQHLQQEYFQGNRRRQLLGRESKEGNSTSKVVKKSDNEAVSAGSGDSAAVVDRKSSEGEFDPISNKDGDDGDFSPPVKALKAMNPRIN